MSMGLRLVGTPSVSVRSSLRSLYSRMARWLDEEQAAVDAGVLNIAVTLSSKLLSEICGVLILDVLHNRIPADHNIC